MAICSSLFASRETVPNYLTGIKTRRRFFGVSMDLFSFITYSRIAIVSQLVTNIKDIAADIICIYVPTFTYISK